MKPINLIKIGFTVAGLLVGIAIGIWMSLCFFYVKDGTPGRRIAALFVIAGIILMQVVRYKASQRKNDS